MLELLRYTVTILKILVIPITVRKDGMIPAHKFKQNLVFLVNLLSILVNVDASIRSLCPPCRRPNALHPRSTASPA